MFLDIIRYKSSAVKMIYVLINNDQIWSKWAAVARYYPMGELCPRWQAHLVAVNPSRAYTEIVLRNGPLPDR